MVRLFAQSLEIAAVAVAAIVSKAPIFTASKPGRITINAPAAPTIKAVHLQNRTRSENVNIAPRVTNNGPVKARSVASAKGISERAVNQVSIDIELIQARNV